MINKSSAIVSIDIGIKNLAGVIITNYNQNLKDINIHFDLYDLTKCSGRTNVSVSRSCVIKNIFATISQNHIIDKIIIERQVQQNTIAHSLMYSIISIALFYVEPQNIIIFDPKIKFTKLCISYTTKNKEHKKLSVNLIHNFLINTEKNNNLKSFEALVKKDDVADALLQALVITAEHNYLLKELRKLLLSDEA